MTEEEIYSCLHPSLRFVLSSWLKWEDLRNIQKKTIRTFKPGRDLLIISPTAGGKSEAAFIPVLDNILKHEDHNPVCLYIAPQKALINDMAERLLHLFPPLHLDLLVCHGDAPFHKDDSESPVLILTTPESLMVLLYRKDSSLLSSIRFCIIDELHALAGSERGSQILAALSRIEEKTKNRITRIGLSATIGNPDTILAWFGDNEPVLICEEREPRSHEFHLHSCDPFYIPQILSKNLAGKRSLIFTGSRKKTETLGFILKKVLPSVFVHHSSLSSDIRRNIEYIARKGLPFTIVCTSTLELGIDIGDLDIVVQIGPPSGVSSFLQRLGRTGRRNGNPVMYCLTTSPEDTCITVSALMNAMSGMVEPVIPVRYPYHLLTREILLCVFASKRVSMVKIESMIRKKPYLSIKNTKMKEIISHLLQNGWLSKDGDLFIPGPEYERFIKKPGLLFSVIRDTQVLPVITNEGDEIGFIQMKSGKNRFLLGGFSWESTLQDNKNVVVQSSTTVANPPAWSGSPVEESHLILSGIRTLVAGCSPPFDIPEPIQKDLDTFRGNFPEGLSSDAISIYLHKNQITIYTFFGKTWNRILSTYLTKNLGYPCRDVNSYQIILSGEISRKSLEEIFSTIRKISVKDLAESAAPPSTYGKDLELLPQSCIREQWCIDDLHIPHLIHVIQDIDVVYLN
ncbi:DEAD/DEAH box helicase [Methanospirillum sp.]